MKLHVHSEEAHGLLRLICYQETGINPTALRYLPNYFTDSVVQGLRWSIRDNLGGNIFLLCYPET
jgi:hypothetical protein